MKQMKQSWNEVLRVEKNETLERIRKQYLRLALVHHPDKSVGDDKMFKMIVNAYEERMSMPEKLEFDYTLSRSDEMDDILEYLFNIRKLGGKITVSTLKSLTNRYNMTPFQNTASAHIDVLFVRICREQLNEKLEMLGVSCEGIVSKEEAIELFLFAKKPKSLKV